MTERTLPDLIAELCTELEQEAIHYVFRQHLGMNHVARKLGIAPPSLRGRLDAARRKLNRAGSHTANPQDLYAYAEWIRQRNKRDVIPDEPQTPTSSTTSADAQLYDMGRTDTGLRGIPLAGSGPGATHIDIRGMTVSSRPDHAILRLIA